MKNNILLVLLLISIVGNTQSNIVSTGSEATNSSGSLSVSVGQISFVSESNASGSMNSGNQQAFEIFSNKLTKNSTPNFLLQIAPNPTSDFLSLVVEDLEIKDLNFTLFDGEGKILIHSNIEFKETQIDFRNFANGIYSIAFYKNQSILESFKIIKN
ncbi:MAG: T9SS type A sorting domain-containing protein [Flavobacteriia bacterium]